jgi:hypothetical protein
MEVSGSPGRTRPPQNLKKQLSDSPSELKYLSVIFTAACDAAITGICVPTIYTQKAWAEKPFWKTFKPFALAVTAGRE